MITKILNRQKSIKIKLLLVIMGVTVISLLSSSLIEIIIDYFYHRNDTYDYWNEYKWKIAIVILTSAFGGLFAYVVALRLQDLVTKPIYHMSALAATLAETHDYSMRAKKFSDDELGLMADALNDMIIGMEENNKEIKNARNIAQKATDQKSAFLAMMSHEIRTPINGIIGSVDLLGETRLTGQQRQYVDVIEKSAVTLFELINDVLDFSKIEANRLQLEHIEFDFIAHIHDVIDIVQYNVAQKGLQLYFTNNLSQNYMVTGDPIRIKQILMNLVSNAIKFTEKGSITITLAEDTQNQNPDNPDTTKQFSIRITDTGIGIPRAQHNAIFESFTQASESTTRKYGGTGLGLTICKKLVTLMGGLIGLESAEGIGSTFWFSIPMTVSHKQKPMVSKIFDTHAPTTQGARVLFVEDNETNIMITYEMLQQSGYDVTLARNGAEALACYIDDPFELILMDCQMPVMDGWEATAKIRDYEAQSALRPSTIIALTANAMEGDRDKCIHAGMDDYLSKPFKKAELFHKLNSIR